ncbi:MAG TPA: hypothetical protein VIY49_03810 [Bryobacteraceae bacterium]
MKQIWAAVFGLAVGTGALASTIEPGSASSVRVCVEDSVVTPFVLIRGESIATEIFGNIGIRLKWVRRTRCDQSSIAVQVSTGAPPGHFPGALGYTRLAERQIEVFYDRVERIFEAPAVPNLLGHVLAHEIAHVLEGVNRHSAEGLMKAHWDSRDYVQMYPHLLPFAPEDVELIRARLGAFTSR